MKGLSIKQNTELKAQPKERTFPCLLLLLCFDFRTEKTVWIEDNFSSPPRGAIREHKRKLFSPLARRLF